MEIAIEKNKDFRLYIKSIDEEQVFSVVSIVNKDRNPIDVFEEAYNEVCKTLINNKIVILHERIFCSNYLYKGIDEKRKNILCTYFEDSDIPYTFIEGNPYWGKGVAGINIHGVILKDSDSIKNVVYENKVYGRLWCRDTAEYLLLNSIHGLTNGEDSYNQTLNMFEKTNSILKENGFKFDNVIRTWIYLHNILDQYDDFNKARSVKFREFKLIPDKIEDSFFEQVYMPASTGIGCSNPFQAAGVMDVLAIKAKKNSNLLIHNESGKKQKSAYRYGSAFSRAMVLEECENKYIYLSGTASINDKGETVYIDNIKGQIEMTGSVINLLAGDEGFDADNICEGTVFLKKADYIYDYEEYCKKENLNIPCIVTITDVCRDNLLFEIDATFMGKISGTEKNSFDK